MLTLLLNSVLFAQGAEPQGDANAFPRMMLLIMGFGLLMYFLMLRPQKRKEEEFRRMVSQLKENDHVVTAGGIHGVVTNVQREAERVTIRVDESTGTKLRVSTSSIARVISDEGEETKVSDGGAK